MASFITASQKQTMDMVQQAMASVSGGMSSLSQLVQGVLQGVQRPPVTTEEPDYQTRVLNAIHHQEAAYPPPS